MKSALLFFFCLFSITTSVAPARSNRAFRNVRNTAGFSWPAGEYVFGDAIYGFCTLKSWKPAKVGPQFVKDAAAGLFKELAIRALIDADCSKTAIAAHLVFQNYTLVKNALCEKSACKNLVPHMAIKTCLPVLFWCLRKIKKQKHQYVF